MKNKLISLLLTLVMCLSSLSMVFATITVDPDPPADLPVQAGDMMNTILGAAQTVGVIVAIAIAVFYGFKYMTAGAGEKAETKKLLVPFAIGAFVIGAGPYLVSWVWNALFPAESGTGS